MVGGLGAGRLVRAESGGWVIGAFATKISGVIVDRVEIFCQQKGEAATALR